MTRLENTHVGTRGENAAIVLDGSSDRWVNVPLPTGHEDLVPFRDAMDQWLRWFGIAEAVDVEVRDRYGQRALSVHVSDAPRPVYLSAVGTGVSQVLPVILQCLLSIPADLLILEQPELHLHPALQKRLADFLLAFVRAGRQIIVETHSDHLVNQLRTQVASDETDTTRELVTLLFAEKSDGITTYRKSEINEYGGLSEGWPDGFLDISARSAQDLVRHSLRKMHLNQTPTAGQAP